MENVWNEIVFKTRKYVVDAGFEKVILGISGGIDSAVIACIGAAALGPANVLAVMMPSPYSSEGSITDSADLAQNNSIKTITIPIEPLMNSFDVALEGFFRTLPRDTTEENIQARIRAVLLMALSNKYGSLLLNTCNKSEDYVGYCTLYGDSCGAIAPIGDLYKTQVYELAKWINKNPKLGNIPEAIINKPPSAELCDNQKDTDSLPPYDELDSLLRMYVDHKMTKAQIIARGADPRIVEKIIRLVNSSEFKRQQSPPVIKLTGDGR